MTFNVSIDETISIHEKLSTELIPGNQSGDWRRRWQQIQEELRSISTPSTDTRSGDTIHAWAQRLFSFFILAYHLKDALRDDTSSLGIDPRDIEAAIKGDLRLALLADLANLDKHRTLTRPPRSGCIPEIGQISGVDNPIGKGWLLSIKVKHGETTLDGLDIARSAVLAWQEKLAAWQII